MKRLLVLRHAKSSWDDASLADFDRPLNDRGRKTAPFMGALMSREGLVPDRILSSPARRARETAELTREAADLEAPVMFDERIYEATAGELVRVVSELGNEVFSALLVGHNPGMEGVVRVLTGEQEEMPTAALAVIDLDVPGWSSVSPASGRLIRIFRPKEEMRASS